MANLVPPVPPSAAGAPPAGTAVSSAALTLTVANPPSGLSQIAIGTAIQGTVIPSEVPGSVQIQTPVGTLTAPSQLALPQNAVLSLLLQALNPNAKLQITAIDGKLPALALQTGTGNANAPLQGVPATGAGAAPAPTVSLATAPVITATVLAPSTSGGAEPAAATTPGTAPANAATATPANTGTTPFSALAGLAKSAAAKIGLNTPPGPTRATGRQTPASAQSAAAGRTAGSNIPAGRQQSLPAVTAGTRVPVRVTNLQPPVPGSTPTPPPPAAIAIRPGLGLSGIVTGTTQAGHTIVQTPAGQISLPLSEPAATGTSITFEIAGRPLPPPALGATASLPADLAPLARQWPALEEAVVALRESHPALAQHIVANMIPRLDAQLTAHILFFLFALRGGDIRTWLGEETMRALDNTRPELANRLRAEFGQLSRTAEEPAGGDWRATLIPLNNGEAIELVHMFMRRRKKRKDDQNDTETRFVIDVSLTKLGRIQLDGLIGEREKRLDLIVRSQSPLPGNMQNDIRGIFTNAGEVTGMKGGLSFQAAPPNFVEIPASAPGDSKTGWIA